MGKIFDIGANIGKFTEAWLKSNQYNEIICVEANPALIVLLKEKFKDNKNVIILNKLVSNVSAEKKNFIINNDHHTLSTASEDWIKTSRFSKMYENSKQIEVETITLDDLVKEYGKPNLIKIDVEGYELEVLQGLSEKQADICFEWVDEGLIKAFECCQHLMKIGYDKFGYCFKDNYTEFPEKYCSLDDLLIDSESNKWGNIFVK